MGILRFQKRFNVDVLGFQNELCCTYLGLFLLGDFLRLLFEKLGEFFSYLQWPEAIFLVVFNPSMNEL